MAGRQGWLQVLVLTVVLLAPGLAQAGPYLGEWSWCWHPDRDCPRREYSALHYWVPGLYKVRANVHPANLDQYPGGPCGAEGTGVETTQYPCRTTPAAPTRPYADPAGYYGRQVVSESTRP